MFRCVASATLGKDAVSVRSEWLIGKKAAKKRSAQLLYDKIRHMLKNNRIESRRN